MRYTLQGFLPFNPMGSARLTHERRDAMTPIWLQHRASF